MAKSKGERTLRNKSWAENWPPASRQGQDFFHADGIDPDALEVLRGKGYTPVDIRSLDGAEQIEAMFIATTKGVFDPDPAQLKVLDLHMKHLKEKKPEDDRGNRGEVMSFTDLLQSMCSRERPEWAKAGGDVVETPTPETKPSLVADLMGKLFK